MNKKAADDDHEHSKEQSEEVLHLSIDGKIYDVTKYQYEHPGGRIAFQLQKNKDCTDLFHSVGHSKQAIKLLQKYRIRKDTSNISAPRILQETRQYNAEQSRRKLFVFILSMVATSTTIYSYWNMICNKNAASRLDTLADLMYEVMTSIYLPTQLLLGSFMVADYVLVDDCRANFKTYLNKLDIPWDTYCSVCFPSLLFQDQLSGSSFGLFCKILSRILMLPCCPRYSSHISWLTCYSKMYINGCITRKRIGI